MPPSHTDSKLREVLTFYEGVVSVSPEGETLVSGESHAGLGMNNHQRSFLSNLSDSLFGSLLRLASFPSYSSSSTSSSSHRSQSLPEAASIPKTAQDQGGGVRGRPETEESSDGIQQTRISSTTRDKMVAVETTSQERAKNAVGKAKAAVNIADRGEREGNIDTGVDFDVSDGTRIGAEEDRHGAIPHAMKKNFKLTDFIPDPGYFLAGAIAGGVSRTATAPLDRLKVYLLVNTTADSETALAAIKQGRPIAAAKNAARPFTDAVRHLYRSGGLKGFFAGEYSLRFPTHPKEHG